MLHARLLVRTPLQLQRPPATTHPGQEMRFSQGTDQHRITGGRVARARCRYAGSAGKRIVQNGGLVQSPAQADSGTHCSGPAAQPRGHVVHAVVHFDARGKHNSLDEANTENSNYPCGLAASGGIIRRQKMLPHAQEKLRPAQPALRLPTGFQHRSGRILAGGAGNHHQSSGLPQGNLVGHPRLQRLSQEAVAGASGGSNLHSAVPPRSDAPFQGALRSRSKGQHGTERSTRP